MACLLILRWTIVVAAVLLSRVLPGKGWTQDELDLFDLVEEVDGSFYDLMQLDQAASSSDVRRAYRQLSLQLHPDKNDEEDAAEKFRIMMAVAEVLRNEEKREMYDRVLKEGLPDWKQPLFYYRRMRKMGLLELSLLLLLMLSVGHYLFRWAVFAEKQLTIQDYLSRKQRKESRKSAERGKGLRRAEKLEAEVKCMELEAQAYIPHLKDLLPVLLAKSLLWLVCATWKWLDQKLIDLSATTTTTTTESPETDESQDLLADSDAKLAGKRPYGGTRRRRFGAVQESRDGGSRDVASAESGKDCTRHENYKENDTLSASTKDPTTEQDATSFGKQAAAHFEAESFHAQPPSASSLPSQIHKTDAPISHNSIQIQATSPTTHHTPTGSQSPKVKRSQDRSKGQKVTEASASQLTDGREDEEEEGEGPKLPSRATRLSKTLQKQKKKSQRIHDLKNMPPTAEGGMAGGCPEGAASETNPCTQESNSPQVHGSSDISNSLTLPKLEASNDTLRVPLQETETEGLSDGSCRGQSWTQFQQKQLEWALAQFPKFSKDRWLNIARSVPGKTQEECIQRCRQLFEDLKRKREATS